MAKPSAAVMPLSSQPQSQSQLHSQSHVLIGLPTDVWVMVLEHLPFASWSALRGVNRELWRGAALRCAEVVIDATATRTGTSAGAGDADPIIDGFDATGGGGGGGSGGDDGDDDDGGGG